MSKTALQVSLLDFQLLESRRIAALQKCGDEQLALKRQLLSA